MPLPCLGTCACSHLLGKAVWRLLSTPLEAQVQPGACSQPCLKLWPQISLMAFHRICPDSNSEEVTSCCSRLLHVLGWRLAEFCRASPGRLIQRLLPLVVDESSAKCAHRGHHCENLVDPTYGPPQGNLLWG